MLPQSTVSLAMPTQGTSICPSLTSGSNCIRNVPAGDGSSFQQAINAASCGDTIVLTAGSTYSGNFTIPSTSCSGWIEIVSSNVSSLPSPGHRVGPSDVSNMATISTPNTSTGIQFLPQSNHWRLIGLEITTSYLSAVNANYNLVSAGLQADGSTEINVQSQLPADLIFDRVYIHGLSDTNTKRGIEMDGVYIGVVDSYCDEIHYNGNDSQCFASWNGAGPFLIQNDFIEAGAEDILFGGTDPAIKNLIPSDITIIGNLIQKNLTWRNEAAPYHWVIKNLVEFKNAQRVLLDGNVIQYIWAAGQVGFAVLLTPRNQDGTCSWCSVNDITITHNLIRHASGGTEIAGSDNNDPSLPTARLLIRNNLYDDISNVNWGGHGWAFEIATSAITMSPHDLTIDHNTLFPDQAFLILGDSGTAQSTEFTNNISSYGHYGIYGTGVGSGTPALATFVPSSLYNDTVLITSTGVRQGIYPPGTLWSTPAAVQFTNFASGKYQLLSTSPYHNGGTDGRDIGVWDWACLNADSTAALAGDFGPNLRCRSSGGLPPAAPTDLTATVE
jgi:hypothetical protein